MSSTTTVPGSTAIKCPSCGKWLRAPSGLKARAKVSCKSCQHVFRIAETVSVTAAAASATPIVNSKVECERSQPGATAQPIQRRSIQRILLLLLMLCLFGGSFMAISRRSVHPLKTAQFPVADPTSEDSDDQSTTLA